MAFDGITVAGLCSELQETAAGGRIYKIAQTDKNELGYLTPQNSERRMAPVFLRQIYISYYS